MAKPRPSDSKLATRKLLAAARGARLCYGEPVQVDGRTVITVARVRAAGGFGQAGGGGRVDAVPVGFIEVSATGTRFEPIGGGGTGTRQLAAAGAAATALVAAALVKRPRRALPRSQRQRLLPR
jgi:hypothetical protein